MELLTITVYTFFFHNTIPNRQRIMSKFKHMKQYFKLHVYNATKYVAHWKQKKPTHLHFFIMYKSGLSRRFGF